LNVPTTEIDVACGAHTRNIVLVSCGMAPIPGRGDGFTCCQADDLMTPTSTANERIDLVLYTGAFRPTRTEVVGTDPMTGRTPTGKWPTDHFAVRSALSLPVPALR